MNSKRFRSASRKQIGTGVSSTVDICESKEKGFTFVIKRYFGRESYETKKEYHQRVLAEYKTIHGLHHPNIIEVYQYKILFSGGSVKMYMEAGTSDFSQLLRSNYFTSDDQLLGFWRQLYDGIFYLHNSAKLCHRDLKLSNLVLAENGTTLKIIDFLTASSGDKPATGLVGTPAYAAPETFVKIRYDGCKADIWAMGIILVYFMARKFPWLAASHEDVSFQRYIKIREEGNEHISRQQKTSGNELSGDATDPSIDNLKDEAIAINGTDNSELTALVTRSVTRLLTRSSTIPVDPVFGVNPAALPLVNLMLESDPNVRSSIVGIQTYRWFQMLPESPN